MGTLWVMGFASCVVVASGACGKDKGASDKGGGTAQKVPPPFALTIEKVEHHDQLATNPTYAEQGLGKKPAEGKTFSCVFYKLENTSSEKKIVSQVFLVDAKGARIQPSLDAAGAMPSEWKRDLTNGELAPGASAAQINCYEVPKPGAAAGMKLFMEDTGWGPKHPPWELTVPLP